MAYPPSSQALLWTEEEPFKDRGRLIPQKEVQELRRQLIDLSDAEVIPPHQTIPRPPKGTKINKTIKFCMDFYWYNKRKVPDFYTDQRIEGTLNRLAGNKMFSVLGLVTDLGQVPMYPGEREYPYTILPVGFYETERMQPGYCDMLVTFQRLMEYIMKDLHMADLIVFLDYLIVFGSTFEEHQARLNKTFERIQKEDYKVSLERSHFCVSAISCFGHLISGDGITVAAEKVEAMSAWPTPRTASELKSFLEFCGFYQHFYKDFAKLAEPLTQLLRDVAADKQKDDWAPHKLPWWKRESIEERWTKECNEAYRSLKDRVTCAPVLDRVHMTQRHPYR